MAAAAETGHSLFRYLGGVNARELPVPMMNIINGRGPCPTTALDISRIHDYAGRGQTI